VCVFNAAMSLSVMLDRMMAVNSNAAMPAIMRIHNQRLCCQLQTSPELWERHDAIPTTDRKHACAYTDAMDPETHIQSPYTRFDLSICLDLSWRQLQ